MTAKEYNCLLWKEYVENTPIIQEEDKSGFGEFGLACSTDISLPYMIYQSIMKDEHYLFDESTGITYRKREGEYQLIWHKQLFKFGREEIRSLIISLIQIFEEVLPLGSIVDLKKSYLENMIPLDGVGKIRLVILHRFVNESPEGMFYPYSGTIYPTGIPGSSRQINFSPALIERVVYKGFHDEQEDAYVYLMKKEFLIDRQLKSVGFADEDERKTYQNFLRRELTELAES